MNSNEKIARIRAWNESPLTHELTCRNFFCGDHKVLEPKLSPDEPGEVVLVCPSCHYVYKKIPDACHLMSLEELKAAEDDMDSRFLKG